MDGYGRIEYVVLETDATGLAELRELGRFPDEYNARKFLECLGAATARRVIKQEGKSVTGPSMRSEVRNELLASVKNAFCAYEATLRNYRGLKVSYKKLSDILERDYNIKYSEQSIRGIFKEWGSMPDCGIEVICALCRILKIPYETALYLEPYNGGVACFAEPRDEYSNAWWLMTNGI